MFSVVELNLSFLYFITFIHDDSCCAFVCLFENDVSFLFQLCESFNFVV